MVLVKKLILGNTLVDFEKKIWIMENTVLITLSVGIIYLMIHTATGNNLCLYTKYLKNGLNIFPCIATDSRRLDIADWMSNRRMVARLLVCNQQTYLNKSHSFKSALMTVFLIITIVSIKLCYALFSHPNQYISLTRKKCIELNNYIVYISW